jgi:hypothetical protein
MPVSTVAVFFELGMSGFSNSASFRADKIVAANRIANFLSSVIGCAEKGFTVRFSSESSGWVLAMIAKGKELIATTLLALTFVFLTVGAQVGLRFLHLLPATPFSHPTLIALQAFLIVFVGIAVRKIRSIRDRRRACG